MKLTEQLRDRNISIPVLNKAADLLDECEDVLDEAMIELDALRSGRTADRIAATLAKLRA